MKDQSKTKQALIQELVSLRQRIAELERSESERKQAEEALCLHNEIFTHMLESVHLVRVDDGVIVYTNQRFDSVFGYNPDELVGKHVSVINTPGEKSPEDVANEIIRSLKQAGGIWNGEVHNIRKDGTSFWCQANVSAFKDSQYGEVWISVNREITEHKQIKEALRMSEENFRRSLNESPLGVRIVTAEGETIYANRAILDIYGYDSMEDLKTTPVEKRYTPESLAEYQIRREKRKRGGDAPPEYEISIIRKDGEVRHLQVFRKGILWNGEKQFQVLYNDITERKRVEEALRGDEQKLHSIINGSPIPTFVIGKDHRVIHWNKALEEMSRIKPMDVIGTCEHWKAFYSEERPCMGDLLVDGAVELVPQWYSGKYIKSPFIEDAYEATDFFPALGENGKWLRFTAASIQDSKGMLVAAVETLEDITEHKRAEEELRTSRLQLRALASRLQKIREEERAMIAREIHDEMGGGLTGLKMDLSWLLHKISDADPGEERAALMDRIHASNTSIHQMIRVVRCISTNLRPSILDDLGLIAALEWQLSEFTSRTEIPHEFATTFEYVNLEEEAAVAVFRIFQEALTNAVRHAGASKVTVVLREGERSLFGDETVVLEIRDNGRGITEKEIRNPESLGLLGMKERVLAFGGELSICGEPCGGTTLILKIPQKQGESS